MQNILLCSIMLLLVSCDLGHNRDSPLPILGHRDIVDGDTIYHTVPDFKFTDQHGLEITPASFDGKAYIVDYFFTSCPTICPRVKREELRLYKRYKNHPKLSFLSVSIDPEYDDVKRLANYAERLEIEKGNWHFVTGDKNMIYDISAGFFHTAMVNKDAPGGYDHDGKLILIDKNMHIRGFCDGLIPEEVNKFVYDIENLLNEH